MKTIFITSAILLSLLSFNAQAHREVTVSDLESWIAGIDLPWVGVQSHIVDAIINTPAKIETGHAFGCDKDPTDIWYLLRADDYLSKALACQAAPIIDLDYAPLDVSECTEQSPRALPIIAEADRRATISCHWSGHSECKLEHEIIYTTDKQCAVISKGHPVNDSSSVCGKLAQAHEMLAHAESLHRRNGNCKAWTDYEKNLIQFIQKIRKW